METSSADTKHCVICGSENSLSAAECTFCGRGFTRSEDTNKKKSPLTKLLIWLYIAFSIYMAADLLDTVTANWQYFSSDDRIEQILSKRSLGDPILKWIFGSVLFGGLISFVSSRSNKKKSIEKIDH